MTEDTYTIRLARREELPLLNEIECAAASLFREVGFDFAADMGPLSLDLLRSLQSKEQVWIAADRDGLPVGFTVVQIIDGLAHLEEISVHPRPHQRPILNAKAQGRKDAELFYSPLCVSASWRLCVEFLTQKGRGFLFPPFASLLLGASALDS